MNKIWKKESNNIYTFAIDDKLIGSLELQLNNKGVDIIRIDKDVYTVEKPSFWKANIIIFDQEKNIVIQTSTEKWYSNKFKLEFKNKTYTLLCRNNPLSEWTIQLDEKDILAYGLNAEKNSKVNMKVSSSDTEDIFLLDFLLFYLFLPIAIENMGNEISMINLDL